MPDSILVPHGLTSNGLGKDIWTATPKQITDCLVRFYVIMVLYFAQVALLKLSMLFFYLRIFQAPRMKKLIIGTIVFDTCYGIAFVLAAIFTCTPIRHFWENWDGEHQGSCVNINILGWSNAGISIALDVWMFALPVSQLVGLQMYWKKKVGVLIMFAVGTLWVLTPAPLSNYKYWATAASQS